MIFFFFQLYEDYADKFDLSECKLAIVHCAGLYDSALIENLWQNIIDKGNFLESEILSWFRNSFLAHRIRISEILPWDRKFYLTHAILPRTSITMSSCEIAS